ncbi:unnamed protein product [Trichobilharzia szidati]|nr:unnamed protein product [Trichobilharzia szidati]
MLYGIPWIFVSVLFIFTEVIVHVINLRVTHNASIPITTEAKNLRILYRFYQPENLEYLYVASVNSIKQYKVGNLQFVTERITGPRNFSICCPYDGDNYEKCSHADRSSLPFDYGYDSCLPRPTDNYVKTWGTSGSPGPEIHSFNYSEWDFESQSVNDDRITFEDSLYVCHTLYHGYCERLNLINVSQEAPWSAGARLPLMDRKNKNPEEIPVVGSLPHTHSVLVVGSEYIYVATEPDGLEDLSLIKYNPLTVRLKDFQLCSTPPSFESSAQLSTNPSLKIQYKSGFRYRPPPTNLEFQEQLFRPPYIFFVLQQPEDSTFLRWQSRIARICDGDKFISSYAELNIACFQCETVKDDEKMFNALRFASRGTVGKQLADELLLDFQTRNYDISHSRSDLNAYNDFSEVLLVAFAPQPVDPVYYWSRNMNPEMDLPNGQYNSDRLHERGSILLAGSAISMFSMAEVNAKFDRVIMDCLNGEGMRGPSHFLHSADRDKPRCVKDEHFKNFIYDCPNEPRSNPFITGHGPDDDLSAPAFLNFESNVTGMAITAVSNNFTVAVFTTDDGYLYKYELIGLGKVHPLGSLQLVPNGKPITSLALDYTGTIAFASSFQKIYRVELSNCSAYLTCKSCLNARDPYCGWCIAEGRCLLFHQCPLAVRFSSSSRVDKFNGLLKKRSMNGFSGSRFPSSYPVFWLHYNISTDKCPVISQVSPPGIHVGKVSVTGNGKDATFKDDSHYRQQNIILSLDTLLLSNSNLQEEYFSRKKSHQMHSFGDLMYSYRPSSGVGSGGTGARLFCSFREAPISILQHEPLISGTLSNFDLNKILVSVPQTPLITRTVAELSYTSGKPVEAHCLSPVASKLPRLEDDKVSLPLLLWLEKVSVTGSGTEVVGALAPAVFSIYNCSQLKDCKSCARSRFICAWCLFEDLCVPAFPTILSDGEIMNTVCKGPSYNSSTSYAQMNSAFEIIPAGHAKDCPSFKGSSQVITLTSGSPLATTFHVSNVQKQQVVEFTCSENCTNQRVRALFNPFNSTVSCYIEMISLTRKLDAHSSKSVVPSSLDAAVNCGLDLYWHGPNDRDKKGHRMVNEDQIHAEVYACEWLAKYCDECLLLPPRFGCVWCGYDTYGKVKGGSCRTQKSCIEQKFFNGTTAVHQRPLRTGDICPNPEILSLSPSNGTLTGQPILTISGRNLGREASDIIDVFLEIHPRIRCFVLSETYQHSHKFKCKLSTAPSLSLPVSGQLKVVISNKRYEASSPIFRFLAPQLINFAPQRGPKAGGTRLYLSGTNLNTGDKRSVYLYLPSRNSVTDEYHRSKPGESSIRVKCEIEQESETLIICLTGPLPEEVPVNSIPGGRSKRQITPLDFNNNNDKSLSMNEHIPLSLVIMHDQTPTYLSHAFSFIYSPNPSIHEVQRKHVLAGGGTTLHVTGTFLFVIHDPKLVFYFNGSQYSLSCSTSSGGELKCLSPSLTNSRDVVPSGGISDESIYVHKELDSSIQSSINSSVNTKQLVTSRLPISQSIIHSYLESKPEFYSSAFTQQSEWPIDIPYGFIMDGVHQLRVFGFIKVFADPIVAPFPDGVRLENLDEYLTNDPASDSRFETNNHGHKHQTNSEISEYKSKTSFSVNSDTSANQLDYSNIRQLVRIHGHFDALLNAPELAKPDELVVRIGNSLICEVNSVILTEIRCDVDRSMIITHQDYPVEIQFGRFLIYRPGSVRFVALRQAALRSQIIMILIGLVVIFIFVGLIGFVIWRRFIRRQKSYQAKLHQKYAEHENRVIRIFKEDFMELQTSMQEFSQEVKRHNLPFRDYRTFCLFSLFPEYHCELMNPVNPHSSFPLSTDADICRPSGDLCISSSTVPPHPLLLPFTVNIRAHDDAAKAISLFHILLCNRQFLYLLIHLIEKDEHIMAKDKSRIASLLSIALQPKMDYLTSVMFDLMSDVLYQLHHQGDSYLVTAFRRSEKIVDKILSNWLTFHLYKFIKNNVGENLFYFYRALLQRINMGPRDAITGKARYTLDSAYLLQTELTGNQIILCVEDPQHLFDLPTPCICVKVLDCDTITQAKEKILDAIYKNKPYSKQIKSTQLELQKLDEQAVVQNPENEFCTGQILSDWDVKIRSTSTSMQHEKTPMRLNCVKDYHLKDNTRVALFACEPTKLNHTQSRSELLQSNGYPPQSRLATDSCFPTIEVIHKPSSLNRPLPQPVSPLSTKKLIRGLPYQQPVNNTTSTCNASFTDERLNLSKVPTSFDPAFCFRPTGVPDSKLWYHLEWTGDCNTSMGTNGGVKQSNKYSRYINKKSNHLHRLIFACSHKSDCCCLHVNEYSGGDTKTRSSIIGNDIHENETTQICSACSTRHPLLACNEMNPHQHHCTQQLMNKSKSSKKWKNNRCHSSCTKNKTGSREISTLREGKDGSTTTTATTTKLSESLSPLVEPLPREVFFNRLLLTRLSVMKYMDRLFEVIFSSVYQSQSLPAPIKFLFDFLDDRAIKLGVQDSRIVHAWKSNCIQMRFWNQIITNLDYIFDISLLRNTALERSFHAFSHAMTYACTPIKEKVTKDSSCIKLLFAPDISQQWDRVHSYYREVKALPAVEQEEMNDLMRQHSINHSSDFNVSWAVYELYTKYVRNLHDMLVAHLQQDAINRSFNSYRTPEQNMPNNCNPLEKGGGGGIPAITEWNPVQIIQILIEIRQCLDNVQNIQSSTGQTAHANVTSFPPNSTKGDVVNESSVSKTAAFRPHTTEAGNFSQPSSAPSQTATTDCLDTLRSYNTLTTEFAGDETSRSAHHYYYHHHYYHYHPSDTTQMNTTVNKPTDLSVQSAAAISTSGIYADSVSKYKDPLA